MDDYAKYYYQRIGSDKGDFGDISQRLKLREDLGCKTFQWYLDTIFPELFIPGDAVAQGEVRIQIVPIFMLLLMLSSKFSIIKNFNSILQNI